MLIGRTYRDAGAVPASPRCVASRRSRWTPGPGAPTTTFGTVATCSQEGIVRLDEAIREFEQELGTGAPGNPVATLRLGMALVLKHSSQTEALPHLDQSIHPSTPRRSPTRGTVPGGRSAAGAGSARRHQAVSLQRALDLVEPARPERRRSSARRATCTICWARRCGRLGRAEEKAARTSRRRNGHRDAGGRRDARRHGEVPNSPSVPDPEAVNARPSAPRRRCSPYRRAPGRASASS